MQIQDLVSAYQTKTNEELLQLAAEPEQLTPEARSALTTELAKRRIDSSEHLRVQERTDQGGNEPQGSRAHLSRPGAIAVGEFIADVLRVYHGQLWLFVKLTRPAVVVGYLALMLGRNEGREIARHLPRGVAILEHRTELFEIWLANTAGYFVSWMASCYSFGAISSAVRQITSGDIPSAPDCFVEVRERIGPFVRLSLLLFVLLLVAVGVAGLLSTGIFWMLHQGHYRYGALVIWGVSFGSVGLALLVFSRFGLAVPALVLDNYSASKAMFRSDELTEGKWLSLAVLLAKSLIGGYVAGMLPFWLTRWAWGYIQLPWWVPAIGSIAAVSLVEPFLFIGFALLYIRMSVPSSAPNASLSRQFT
jgi:hypothetical protein